METESHIKHAALFLITCEFFFEHRFLRWRFKLFSLTDSWRAPHLPGAPVWHFLYLHSCLQQCGTCDIIFKNAPHISTLIYCNKPTVSSEHSSHKYEQSIQTSSCFYCIVCINISAYICSHDMWHEYITADRHRHNKVTCPWFKVEAIIFTSHLRQMWVNVKYI